MVVKTKAQAQANFQNSIAYIPARYSAGVKAADWQTPASSDQAESNFAAGVQNAIAKKSRQTGVRSISNTDWQNAAVNKGAPVIGQRISDSLNKWAQNWGPMYDSVVSTVNSLPAATTDYRTNINSRLVPTVEAWKRAAGKM